jgi:hypothetical protein
MGVDVARQVRTCASISCIAVCLLLLRLHLLTTCPCTMQATDANLSPQNHRIHCISLAVAAQQLNRQAAAGLLQQHSKQRTAAAATASSHGRHGPLCAE